MHRAILIILCITAIAQASRAQNLAGLWVGGLFADSSGSSVINTNYMLHVKRQSGNIISGRAYVLERRFVIEGVLDFIGIIENNRAKISELSISSSKIDPELTVGSRRVRVKTRELCLKNLDLGIIRAGGTDHLQGPWTGAPLSGIPCDPGSAVLSRFSVGATSIHPEILQKILADNGPPVFLNTALAEPVVVKVSSRVVSLALNDYLREDDDTVSVYYNRKSLLRNLKIANQPVRRTVRFDDNSPVREVILYAENLGHVPPNTSTLTIDDGKNVQKVSIITTKQVSALIYLKYEPR